MLTFENFMKRRSYEQSTESEPLAQQLKLFLSDPLVFTKEIPPRNPHAIYNTREFEVRKGGQTLYVTATYMSDGQPVYDVEGHDNSFYDKKQLFLAVRNILNQSSI